MKYESCMLKTTQVIVSETKCWQSSVVTLTFDPQIYSNLSLTILHLRMKYESCTLKTTQVIVPVPKCWQSSVVTLTIDPLAPKCISIFLSPSCFYLSFSYNPASIHEISKLYIENYSSNRVRNKVSTKFRCDLDLWP